MPSRRVGYFCRAALDVGTPLVSAHSVRSGSVESFLCRGGFNDTSRIPTDNWVKPAPTNPPLICNNDANGLDITSTLKIDAEFPTLLLLLQPAKHRS
jgi:hypothetical protein